MRPSTCLVRHSSQWPRKDGVVTFSRQLLDFAGLLAELEEPDKAGFLAVLSAYKIEKQHK